MEKYFIFFLLLCVLTKKKVGKGKLVIFSFSWFLPNEYDQLMSQGWYPKVLAEGTLKGVSTLLPSAYDLGVVNLIAPY